jgi:aspartokinase-like uncharacterized kinase
MSRPEERAPVIVKLGGSLLDWPPFPHALAEFLETLRTERVVLVVGGGAMVDVLRTLDSVHTIGENRSDALALRVLDVTARLVADLVPGLRTIERVAEMACAWEDGKVPVLAPRVFMETVDRHAADALPESWSVTSDSIAARVARHVQARRLVLLKSTAPVGPIRREEAARRGLVDPVFLTASAGLAMVGLVNLRSRPATMVELV